MGIIMINGYLGGRGRYSNPKNEPEMIHLPSVNCASDQALHIASDVFHPPDVLVSDR